MQKRKSQNKIVVDYEGEEKLILLAIRDTQTGEEASDALENARKIGFDVVDEIHLNLDEIKKEISRPDFINKEGFVVKFKNGYMVKFKYAEYFRLHKIVCNVNEKFVWEFVSQNKPIELSNIPDETFQFIKDTENLLKHKYTETCIEIMKIYHSIIFSLNSKYGKEKWTKKDFALSVFPSHKKWSGVLFKIYERRYDDASKIVWKMLEPKYEKGVSGFQSMKI